MESSVNINNIKRGDRVKAINTGSGREYDVNVTSVGPGMVRGEYKGSPFPDRIPGTFYSDAFRFEAIKVAPSPEEVNMNNLVTLANLIDKPVFVKIEDKIHAFGILVESKLKAGSPMHPPVVVAVIKIGGTQQLVDFGLGNIFTVTEAS